MLIFFFISVLKDTEVYVDNCTSTFECCWPFYGVEARSMNALAKYENEKTFFVQILGDNDGNHIKTPLIRFFHLKPRNCGFKIAEIAMAGLDKSLWPYDKWIRMKPDQQENDLRMFVAKQDRSVQHNSNSSTKFRVKIVSTTLSYCFFDATWSTDLWSEKQFTDVDILVGENKLQAHRVVLSARSPVLKILLSKISLKGRSTLTIGADKVDFSVVEHFLKYLYMGTLEISANNKQLLALAEMYQVETLKEFCQLAVRVSDAKDITTSFLAII